MCLKGHVKCHVEFGTIDASFAVLVLEGKQKRIMDRRTQQRLKRKKTLLRRIGSCVRACVTEAHATVYVCVNIPKECVCEITDTDIARGRTRWSYTFSTSLVARLRPL